MIIVVILKEKKPILVVHFMALYSLSISKCKVKLFIRVKKKMIYPLISPKQKKNIFKTFIF